MKKHNGLTLLETLVVIAVLLVAGAIWAVISISPLANKMVCGANLNGLGTAMSVYANDYGGRYPQLPGTGPWSKELGFEYDMQKPDFSSRGDQSKVPRTVTASWYLIVREADVSPQSMICPQSGRDGYEGKNPQNLDLVDLWDFGPTPHKYVTYALHNPYGRFPASQYAKQQGISSFAVAADMSPWFKDGDVESAGNNNKPPQIIRFSDSTTWPLGNSFAHRKKGTGQNVLYSDGHLSFEDHPDVGVDNDNIYTFWSTNDNPTEQDIQGGTAPTGRTPDNDAQSETDSFLVL